MIPSSPDEYVKMINDVNREEFGAHLDVVNMITSPQRYFYNSDFLRECFTKLKGKICSCHLKDVVLKPEFTFQLEETACGSFKVSNFIEHKLSSTSSSSVLLPIRKMPFITTASVGSLMNA